MGLNLILVLITLGFWPLVSEVFVQTAPANSATTQQTEKERKEAEKRAVEDAKQKERERKQALKKAQELEKQGCRFNIISPIPELRAVIYIFTEERAHFFTMISNDEPISFLVKGGYYPYVVTPGRYKIGFSEGNALTRTTAIVDTEAGKQYFLELAAGFNYSLKLIPEVQAVKKLRDFKLILPYVKYERKFDNLTSLTADPVYDFIRATDREYSAVVMFPASVVKVVDRRLRDRFDFYSLIRKAGSTSYELTVKSSSFARSCVDRGLISGLLDRRN